MKTKDNPTVEVKAKPIIMTLESVQRIEEGLKKQTRRVIVPQPACDLSISIDRSPHKAGDILWVRQKWRVWKAVTAEEGPIHYLLDIDYGDEWIERKECPDRATFNRLYFDAKWHIPIFMPRWASRLMLKVVDVGFQRVQDITTLDIMAEGFDADGEVMRLNGYDYAYRLAFSAGWDKINGPRGYGWAANPWVWIYTIAVGEGASHGREAGP